MTGGGRRKRSGEELERPTNEEDPPAGTRLSGHDGSLGLTTWQREMLRRVSCGNSVSLLVNGGVWGTSIRISRGCYSVWVNTCEKVSVVTHWGRNDL